MPLQKILLCSLVAFCLSAWAESQDPEAVKEPTDSGTYKPEDYKVYVDKDTGKAYIKTPSGWKFIKRLEPDQIQQAIEMNSAPSSQKQAKAK
jgi:hypothetical protein